MNMSWSNNTEFFGDLPSCQSWQTKPSFHASMSAAAQDYANLENTVHFQSHEIMSLRATIDALTKRNHTLSQQNRELKDEGRKYRSTKNRLGQRCSQISRLLQENQQMKKVLTRVRQTVGE